MMRFPLALLLLAVLAGCSSNPNAIEPNPLPDFESSWKVKRLWSENTGAGVDESNLRLAPAVTERAIYTADYKGRVVATSIQGKRLWRVKTDDRISGGVYAGYGLVLYGTRDGQVVALSVDDGKEKWRQSVSSEVLASPVSDGTRVVIQTLDGHVEALDIDSGEQLWSFDVSVPVLTLRSTAEPLLADNRVFAAFASGRVVALEAASGVPVWERQVAEPSGRSELERLVDVDSNLILDGGGVFASTFQGKLAVLDVSSGRPFWDKKMSTYMPMQISGGVLFVANDVGHVFAIEQRAGSTLWRQEALYGRGLVGVAVQRGQVVTGDEEGYLHWMDTVDGHFLARKRHDRDGFAAAPVVKGDVLYALSRDGKLSAYRIEQR
jgi:outer membrane protein assembly factor BamB